MTALRLKRHDETDWSKGDFSVLVIERETFSFENLFNCASRSIQSQNLNSKDFDAMTRHMSGEQSLMCLRKISSASLTDGFDCRRHIFPMGISEIIQIWSLQPSLLPSIQKKKFRLARLFNYKLQSFYNFFLFTVITLNSCVCWAHKLFAFLSLLIRFEWFIERALWEFLNDFHCSWRLYVLRHIKDRTWQKSDLLRSN